MSSKTLDGFYELTDAEEYFDFFELEYDEKLVHVKRFHILRQYGEMIRTGFEKLKYEEARLLDFLKFSLLKVYGEFKEGYSPSAAEVWGMFEGGKVSGCMACALEQRGGCDC